MWLKTACEPACVKRALKTSLLIGTILVAINHWDTFLAGETTLSHWLKIGLTYLVPYAVATAAGVSATLEARRASGELD